MKKSKVVPIYQKKKKTSQKSKSSVKKRLDKVFSEYIRRSWANDLGMASCYTCGVVKHWKELQCGHFIRRSHLSTRWDEDNCRCQCVGCNVFKGGNYENYADRLMNELGKKGWESLMEKKQYLTPYSLQDMESLLEEYKSKLKEL